MCSVTQINYKTTPYQLEVSIDPQTVQSRFIKEDISEGILLQAAVLSYEGHGIQLDLGVSGTVGFLPKSEYNQDTISEEYPIGKVFLTRVISSDKRVTKVTTADLNQATPKDPLSTVASILPGTLVDVLVTGHRPNGITVKFMGFYDGHINWYHLKESVVAKDHPFSKLYKIGSRFNARVIAVSLSVDEKIISLSAKPHILDLAYNDQYLFELKDGQKVENVNINRIDQYGLACSYQLDETVVPAYIPASQIVDDKIDLMKSDTSNIKPDTTHTARIVGSYPFEGLVKLSIKPSLVETDYYSVKDLKEGQKINGTVKDILSNGIVVSLSSTLTGFVPRSHISDIQLKDVSKKYPKGAKVSARVLNLDINESKLILTLRKSLVKQDGSIISDYSQVESGSLTTGLIKKLLPNGCVVEFFNGTTGFCHISEMSESKVESIQSSFKVGQPVQCKVISSDSAQNKIALTFRTNQPVSAPTGNSNLNIKDLDSFKLGDTVNGKIVKAVADGFIVNVNQTKGFLPHSHLSDHLSLNSLAASNVYSVSSELENLLVIQKTPGKGLLLSKKDLLLKGAKSGNLPHSIESTKVGAFVVGYISSIYDYGVFVNFLGDFSAFCFLKELADAHVASPKSLFTLGQSVIAKVIEVDSENQRAKITLKLSEVRKSKKLPEFATLPSFNKSYFSLLNSVNSSSELTATKPGSVIVADIASKHDFGWRVKYDQYNAILTNDHITESAKSNSKDGQIQCKVLDTDLQQKSLDLTTKIDSLTFPSELDSKISKQLEKAVKSKQKLSANVVLVKDNLILLSLPDYKNVVAFTSPSNYNSNKNFVNVSFGQTCSITVSSFTPASEDFYQLIVAVDSVAAPKEKSNLDSLLSSDKLHLANPVDSTLTSQNDLKPGRVTKALITKFKQDHINATLATNIHASIHITEVYDSYEDIPNPKAPFSTIKIGDSLDCKITGSYFAKTHKSLAITGTSNRAQVYNLTAKPSGLNQEYSSIKIGQLSEGKEYLGFVNEIKKDHLLVSLSPELICKVNLLNISSDSSILSDFKNLFKIGMAIKCRVTKVIKSKKVISAAIVKAPFYDGEYPIALKSLDDVKVGQIVSCKVKNFYNLAWNVQLFDDQPTSTKSKIFATNLADEFSQKPQGLLVPDSIVNAYVLSIDADSSTVSLSLRDHHIDGSNSSEPKDALITKLEDIKEGQVVQGYVYKIHDQYALVALGYNVIGRVQRNRVSDEVVNDIKDVLSVGQLVKSKVTKIDNEKNNINLTLKLSSIDPNADIQLKRVTFNSVKVGNSYSGVVKKVSDFGLFIKLDNSNLTGLCRKNNVADANISDLTDIYQVDEQVKVKVIKVDSAKHRFELGCKASLFEDEESEDEEDQMETEDAQLAADDDDEMDSDSDSDSDASDSSSDSDAASERKPLKTNSNPLIVKGGFNWDDDEDDLNAKNYDSGSDDSDSDEETRPKKKAKKAKTIQDDVTGDLSTATPQVAADYERLLLGSPSSSFLWINYMALQLQLNEIEKARQLANRALDTINIREEQERFNIWIALLNLELKFGDLDQVQSTFSKAVHRVTDVEKLYFQLAKMYSDSNNYDLAQETFKSMCKKFPDSVKVWQTFGEYYMRQGKKIECREVLKKALNSAIKKLRKFIFFHFHYKMLTFLFRFRNYFKIRPVRV
jgi:rRNA biogenesis protein RRP5